MNGSCGLNRKFLRSSATCRWARPRASRLGPAITAAARRDGLRIGVFIVPHDGHYRVQIDGEFVNVPGDAVVTEPNRAGRTMVWPIWLDGHPLLHAGEHDLEISIVQ